MEYFINNLKNMNAHSENYFWSLKNNQKYFGFLMNDLGTESNYESFVPVLFDEFTSNKNVKYVLWAKTLKNHDCTNHKPFSNFLREFKNVDVQIVVDYLSEGYMDAYVDFIHRSIYESNINHSKIFYINGALNASAEYDKFCEKNNIQNKINVYGTNFWEYFSNQHLNSSPQIFPTDYQVKSKNKIFVNFNRILRHHRLIIISLLCKYNLLDKGYISFYPDGTYFKDSYFNKAWENLDQLLSSDTSNEVKKIYLENANKFPLKLNMDNFQNLNFIRPQDTKFFSDSYFSLVTETFFFETTKNNFPHENTVFFTEKTFKPIQMLHPFILVSKHNSLKWLHKLGYKTFHPYINEEYDDIENNELRLLTIANEVKRLSDFTKNQWRDWQNHVKPIVLHNQFILKNKQKSEFIFKNRIL